jgi:5-methylcytosine-specific restriction endonuclease McrA
MWAHGHSGYNNHKCRCDICKAAVNAYNRRIQSEYRQRPHVKEYVADYQAKYRQLKRDEKLAYGVEYKRTNAERLRAKERARAKTAHRANQKRRDAQMRRARKLDQFVEAVDPKIVYQMHGGCCGICRQFVTEEDFHVDHIMPLSHGGLHAYINCQPAHSHCNLSKGAKVAP